MVKIEDLYKVYLRARSNKRRSKDSVKFEQNFETRLIDLCESLNNRTFTADSNYAFVVFSPKPREIFATEMKNRIVHHYMDWRLRPIYEKVLSERSFNNRKGLGLHKAIDIYRNDIIEFTDNFTRDAWCVHLDLKGYFPNADVEIALKQQLDLIDRYYEGEDKEDLKFMMSTCMRADPARHCEVFVHRSNWDAIAPEKSLFNKPTGTGGAIGFLCWQNAMSLYINDVVKWLQSHDFLRVVVFVDDIYIVTNDKARFLALMPLLRSKFAELKVTMNEKKFYLQHYSKGIMCLGTMLKFGRKYMNDRTFNNALKKVKDTSKKESPEKLLCSMNSHLGCFKNRNEYKRCTLFKRAVLDKFGKVIDWNEKKNVFKIKKWRKQWKT